MPAILAAEQAGGARRIEPSADALLIIFLNGGPSHLDMWDMKPEGPTDSKGEFKPIDSSLPGVQVSEHLPKLALIALIDLARNDVPADAGSVARVLGRSPTECATALVRLDELGLCDASRARLTFRGLAAAAALRAHLTPDRADVAPSESASV